MKLIWRVVDAGWRRAAIAFWSTVSNVYLRAHPGVQVDGWVRVTGKVFFKVHPEARLIIGARVRINSGPLINPVGGHRPTIIAVHRSARVEIGAGTGISSSTIVALQEIVIGSDALIGGNCAIYDSDFHGLTSSDRRENGANSAKTKGVHIGARAFIGTGVTILKGVQIGANAVVGAGAVVVKHVPAGELWAGNPARRIGTLNC